MRPCTAVLLVYGDILQCNRVGRQYAVCRLRCFEIRMDTADEGGVDAAIDEMRALIVKHGVEPIEEKL